MLVFHIKLQKLAYNMTDKRKAESGLDEGDLIVRSLYLLEREKKREATNRAFSQASKEPVSFFNKKIRLSHNKLKPSCHAQPVYKNRKGIKPVPTPAFSLNSAVDTLVKQEFDIYRKTKETPDIFKENNLPYLKAYDYRSWTFG